MARTHEVHEKLQKRNEMDERLRGLCGMPEEMTIHLALSSSVTLVFGPGRLSFPHGTESDSFVFIWGDEKQKIAFKADAVKDITGYRRHPDTPGFNVILQAQSDQSSNLIGELSMQASRP